MTWSILSQAGNREHDSLSSLAVSGQKEDNINRIQPYSGNPYYWQYKGKPVLLTGGSYQDNLFNHLTGLQPGGSLETHLDLLVSAGGNFVRNTMSHRNRGNEFAYKRVAGGRFDLTQWNKNYWQRFDNFLRLTEERGIIVQIEIWATYDYGDDEDGPGWRIHPFNPQNNVNYTAQESRLPEEADFHPVDNPFFRSVPELDNNRILLPYQQAFVNKILDYTLKYSHVLYVMNNETWLDLDWGEYWINYIQSRAARNGKKIETTDMLSRPEGTRLLGHVSRPELYTFLEVSQVNRGPVSVQEGWEQLMRIRGLVNNSPRPLNHTKIYGGKSGGLHGTADEGVQKFWRNFMAGSASIRFHRDAGVEAGLGLNSLAQINLRSLQQLANEMDIFNTEPCNELLSHREENEAYCLADAGKQYALYFPDGGAVRLDVPDATGEWRLKWLNILSSTWKQAQILQVNGQIQVRTPGPGHWVALILKN